MDERRATGALEQEVLLQLWAFGRPATPAEVLEELGEDLAYTTIMTVLTRLWQKGLVRRQRSGRAFAYEPEFSEAELTAKRMRASLESTSDRRAALSRFVSELSAREARTLRTLLDQTGRRPRS